MASWLGLGDAARATGVTLHQRVAGLLHHRVATDDLEGALLKQAPAEHLQVDGRHLGHKGQVLAVSATDDVDGSGYLDYVVSGGEDCTARIWIFDGSLAEDNKLATGTYQLFAVLEHMSPVMAVCAGPRWALTGTVSGWLFAWKTRDRSDRPKDLADLEKRTRQEEELLCRSCASARPHPDGGVRQIQFLDRQRDRACTAGDRDGVAVFQITMTSGADEDKRGPLILEKLHALSPPGQCVVRSVSTVPGKPGLLAACGFATASEDSNEKRQGYLWLWTLPSKGSSVAKPETHPMPEGDEALNVVVTAVRHDDLVEALQRKIRREDFKEELVASGLLVTDPDSGSDPLIPWEKVSDMVTRGHVSKFVNVDEDELLACLGLDGQRQYRAGLTWSTLQHKLNDFPAQLVLVAGRSSLAFWKFHEERDHHGHGPQLVLERSSKHPAPKLITGTVGWTATTASAQKCEVWRLGDPKRKPQLELVNSSAVSASLEVASLARGVQSGSHDQLVCGLVDGSVSIWSLQGLGAGELVAQMQSLTLLELVVYPLLEVITFVQMTTFAFGRVIPWREEAVAVPRTVADIIQVDLFDVHLHISTTLLFWVQISLTFLFMLCFIACALLNAPARLNKMISDVAYQAVKDDDEAVATGTSCTTRFLELLRRLIMLFMHAACTILVVPITKSLAIAVSCASPEDKPAHLWSAPGVWCFRQGHTWVVCGMLLLVPAYYYLLLPYALVFGDTSYIQQDELFQPRKWLTNTKVVASAFFLGPMHYVKDSYFWFMLSEFAVKVSLPVVVTMTSPDRPRLQVALLVLIVFGSVTVAFRFPPLVDPCMCVLLQGTKVVTLYCMICGAVAVFLGNASWVPVNLLVVGSLALMLAFAAVACRRGRRKINILWIRTAS